MFCPVCSQEQVSDEVRFCSRCGFLLTGVSQVIANGGVFPQMSNNNDPNAISPRKKGIKQGALLLFLSFIVVPLLAIVTIAAEAEPFFVVAAFILTFVAGILRMLYAFLFESKSPGAVSENVLPDSIQNILPGKKSQSALPPQQGVPAASYVPPVAAPNWRETNDLMQKPPSVTDSTTKLLQKEE
jgi:hypothetical protein